MEFQNSVNLRKVEKEMAKTAAAILDNTSSTYKN